MKWLRKIFGLTQRDERISDLVKQCHSLQRQIRYATDVSPARFAVPVAAVEWEPGDCEVLRDFLTKETGRKLVQICGQHSLQTALKECQGDKGSPEAAGMDAMLRFMFNLASTQQQQRISDAAADSAAKTDTAGGEQDDAVPVESRSF